jgi:hypothetical protein
VNTERAQEFNQHVLDFIADARPVKV